MKNKLIGFLLGLSLVAGAASAADWYTATGNPVARSAMNSAVFRTEFSSIETDIADQLPALTGNGSKVVIVNAGGTALTVAETGIAITAGGTGATTASAARTALGLAIGTNVQAYDAELVEIAALTDTDSNFIVGNGSAWVAEGASAARTSLGLGSLALLSNVSNSNWSGADLALTNGGTGASTAADARTALGLVINSNVQAYDTELFELSSLANTDSNFIVGDGEFWQVESGATARTSIGVGTGDSPQLTAVNVGHASDSTITRVSAGLIAVEGNNVLTQTSGSFTVTLTGFTSATTGTLNWIKIGDQVTLWANATIIGTSNATTMAMTNMPAAIRSTNSRRPVAHFYDGGKAFIGEVIVDSDSSWSVRIPDATCPGSVCSQVTTTFLNSGTKGILVGWTVTYVVD